MDIKGHHHISMYTKNAAINKSFYVDVLGLRLVEKSVNQDNPFMYHLFFGDEIGSPGTLLSFFEIPNIGKNHPGTDSIHRVSLLVSNNEAIQYFKHRLERNNIETYDLIYLGRNSLLFKDPDDLEILLISNDENIIPNQWIQNSYTDIPKNMQILGMGPVEIRVRDKQATIDFLQYQLGYKEKKDTSETVLTLDEKGLYSDFVIIEQQGERVKPGQGYIHHIAVNAPKDNDLEHVLEIINKLPLRNSGIIDRYFFKSLYYRQNKIMFEFATELPGFTVDTPIENLGKELNLPTFLENKREEIEKNLKTI